jgi:endo-1,4-beta-xylanase
MRNNQFFSKTVLGCSAAFILLFTSCSKETLDEEAIVPSKASSAKVAALSNGQNYRPNGFFYTMYSEGGFSDMTFPSEAQYGGNFQINYNNSKDVVGGKGWKPGAARTINYNVGSLSAAGTYDFVGVYGWTKSPLIEYYVTEKGFLPWDYADTNGPRGVRVNTVSADGHTYTFSKHLRKNAPNITGVNGDFWQYIDNWGGQTFNGNKSINMATHINNWRSKGGQGFGSYDYQVFALEAFNYKNGYINATVW